MAILVRRGPLRQKNISLLVTGDFSVLMRSKIASQREMSLKHNLGYIQMLYE